MPEGDPGKKVSYHVACLWQSWQACTENEKRWFLDRVRSEYLKPAVPVDEAKANILAHKFKESERRG